MIFGNLDKVFEGEQSLYEAIQPNYAAKSYKKPNIISDILTKLSHYGMSYSKDVYDNMRAVPANKDLIPQNLQAITNLYTSSVKDSFKVKPEEEKTYSEKTIDQKREVLRKMAQQPEIEDILDTMANECIVYDPEDTYICQPFIDTAVLQMLNEENAEKIRNCMDTEFTKIYMLLEWKQHAWDIFKRYLVDGVLAYEIVYDDIQNPKTILGIVELDPKTLTKSYENGKIYWYQYKDLANMERKLLDAQIIYIKYEDSGVSERLAYVEKLIRPFNIYRIVEQAQIIWTVTQSSFKTMFTIPVSGMSKTTGTQTLMSAMNRYREDISFNAETGELQVNGRTNLPFNKEYWMPENESGTPQIETLADQGPAINDSEQLKYFLDKLYKVSKIPENRFDKESQTTWFGSDATQQQRDEINFSRFVKRLRNPFAEILLKPLRISIALSIPEIKNDKRLLDAVSLRFNSYNLFEEMACIEVDSKRIDFISNMATNLVYTDSEGNEKQYFSLKFLIMKYLKMSDADLELNEKYKLMEQMEANKNSGEDEEGSEEGSEDTGDEGSEQPEEKPESEENIENDSELMGEVQPEKNTEAE